MMLKSVFLRWSLVDTGCQEVLAVSWAAANVSSAYKQVRFHSVFTIHKVFNDSQIILRGLLSKKNHTW